MITKTDILRMVQHIARRSHNIPDTRLMHPGREWAIGLGLFTLTTLIGGVVSARQFWTYESIETQLGEPEVSVRMYDQQKMRAVLDAFDARAIEFQTIRRQSTTLDAEKEVAEAEEGSDLEAVDGLDVVEDPVPLPEEAAPTTPAGPSIE